MASAGKQLVCSISLSGAPDVTCVHIVEDSSEELLLCSSVIVPDLGEAACRALGSTETLGSGCRLSLSVGSSLEEVMEAVGAKLRDNAAKKLRVQELCGREFPLNIYSK